MCPPISCCHQRLTSLLPTQLYYLVRLLLAYGSEELLPEQQQLLDSRLEILWDRVQLAVQHRCHTSPTGALNLTEQLIARLLRSDCCRRSLRRAVSIPEALGPALVLQ
jgi:hypothetical protein